MTKPISISATPNTPDADGLVANGSSAGSSVTLNGALISGGTFTAADGLGHRIDITDTATLDQSSATFTITGTDANGAAVTNSISGPSSLGTVTSTVYFKTVSSITIANPVGSSTVNIGTTDEVATPGYVIRYRSGINVGLAVVATGTLSYTVQHTLDNAEDNGFTDVSWLNHSALVAQTATADGNYAFGVVGTRMVLNSYTAGATFKFLIVQGW